MTQTNVARVQLKRVNAFQGLMIDADIWRDAHDYHRQQLTLHQLALHGWGIAHGLEVTITDGPSRASDAPYNTLTVQPGIAIDPAGNFIVLTEPYVHQLDARKAGPIYLLLQYSEVPTGPMQPPNDPYGQPTRIIEAFRIQQRDNLPADPRVELCRLTIDPLVGAGRVKLAADPEKPGPNEIDTRFRIPLGAPSGAAMAAAGTPGEPALPAALPVNRGWIIEPGVTRPQIPGAPGPVGAPGAPGAPGATGAAGLPGAAVGSSANGHTAAAALAPLSLVVARHAGQGWDSHNPGLRRLARELGYLGHRLEITDAPLADLDKADLVYLTGQARLDLSDSEVQGLRRILERGGAVIGDGCAGGPAADVGARDFAHSFTELAETLGRHLEAAGQSHPLFGGHYLFAQPPPGARESTVLLADSAGTNLFYCDADYGCAWAGGAAQRPLPRGPIRDALELGVNLITVGKP